MFGIAQLIVVLHLAVMNVALPSAQETNSPGSGDDSSPKRLRSWMQIGLESESAELEGGRLVAIEEHGNRPNVKDYMA